MSGPVRLGGRVALPDGSIVVFSVAEGTRGRRWRETTLRDGMVIRSLLLETGRDGRPARLEIDTAAGLLTLHPGVGEHELHGNVVGSREVRHLRFDWSPSDALFVVDSPTAAAAALGALAPLVDVGESRRIRSLAIGLDLEPRMVGWTISRVDTDAWTLRSDIETNDRGMRLDPDGLAVIPDLVSWPLELD